MVVISRETQHVDLLLPERTAEYRLEHLYSLLAACTQEWKANAFSLPQHHLTSTKTLAAENIVYIISCTSQFVSTINGETFC